MLSEEEKKAIEILDTFKFRSKTKNYNKICLEDVEATKIIITLITKLQKENAELQKQCISKDKIRELINERQFELQQEYKDFKDDIRLNTLQEIYYLGYGSNDRR